MLIQESIHLYSNNHKMRQKLKVLQQKIDQMLAVGVKNLIALDYFVAALRIKDFVLVSVNAEIV